MNWPSVILILSILGMKFEEVKNQIIDGFEALENDFNYKVAIFARDRYRCGGGIIDATHVVTAAHCVEEHTASDIVIIAGVTDLCDPERVLRSVKKVHIPEDFFNNRRSNDIAVLTLDEPFVLGDQISAVPLPTQIIPYNFTICWFTGWGLSLANPPTIYESKLSWTLSTLIPDIECECLMQLPVPLRTFCAIDTRKTARPTPGDSGSPIVCDGVAVGIFSVRIHNVLNPVNIFSNIYQHSKFINESTAN